MDIIQISIDQFKQRFQIIDDNPKFIIKANEIKDLILKPYVVEKTIRRNNEVPIKQTKLQIVKNNSITQNEKEFKAMLNKFTNKNKNILTPKLKQLIHNINSNVDIYLHHCLEFIKVDRNKLEQYNEIIDFFDNEQKNIFFVNNWNLFIDNKEWKVPSKFIDLEYDLFICSDNYDIYCDFTKWKNKCLNLITLWKIYISSQQLFDLYNEIYDEIIFSLDNRKIFRHLLDPLIEEISELFTIDNIQSDIIIRFKSLKDNYDLPLSTKFKIERLIEYHPKK